MAKQIDMYDADDLNQAVETLRCGGIILYPTDTVWGLGCDALNDIAVEKLFKLKARTSNKSMLVLVGSNSQLEQTVQNVPDIARQLIDAAINPTTIIYDNASDKISKHLIANDNSIGVRVTDEPFSKQLCLRFGRPIVSTSANISGAETPKTFAEISDDVKQQVDYIVNYRQNDKTISTSSAIIKISDSSAIKIIR